MENDLPFSEMPPEPGLWDTGGLLSPFQPTLHEKIIAVLNKISLSTSDILIDLGCGDGRVLFHAAFMQCHKAIGVELNTELVSQIENRIQELGLEEQIEVQSKDFLQSDLREVTVIYMYLLPEAIEALKEKLQPVFTYKTRAVISLHFPIPWWEGEQYLNYYIYFPQ